MGKNSFLFWDCGTFAPPVHFSIPLNNDLLLVAAMFNSNWN
jgi:hypothetical protein